MGPKHWSESVAPQSKDKPRGLPGLGSMHLPFTKKYLRVLSLAAVDTHANSAAVDTDANAAAVDTDDNAAAVDTDVNVAVVDTGANAAGCCPYWCLC